MSSVLQEQCLGLIYQALVEMDVKLLAVVVLSCPSFFALSIPGSSLMIEPFLDGKTATYLFTFDSFF
jgi:hypothetical protein